MIFGRTALLVSTLAAAIAAHAQSLSPLAKTPDWSRLNAYQETITREDFQRLLDHVYAPDGAARGLIEITPDRATIHRTVTPPATVELRFAADSRSAKPVPRFWRPASDMPTAPASRPLAGVHVALDPGHIGGNYARIEERWFVAGEGTKPVTEGDMTLRVANLLAPQLRALGADVSFVRNSTVPVTGRRADDLLDAASAELRRQNAERIRDSYSGPADALKESSIRWHAERLFYRVSEIRARAALVNRTIKPDITVCLHFNAEPWGDATHPQFVGANHLHLIIDGCFSAAELQLDDVRFEMLLKLLTRAHEESLAASASVAASLAPATGLPPYQYSGTNARPVPDQPYLWTRNLLANRLYRSPVIYLEPYVMNSREVFERIQAGDYSGEKEVAGRMRRSIFREYADAVADGLARYYREARRR